MTAKIALKIKSLRVAAGLSQKDLADKLGVSRVAITKWENGATGSLKHQNLIGMSDLFGVTIDDLLRYGNTEKQITHVDFSRRNTDTEPTQKILAAISSMSVAGQWRLLERAEELVKLHPAKRGQQM